VNIAPEVYVGVAVAVLLLVLFSLRAGTTASSTDTIGKLAEEQSTLSSDSLQMARQIFDPTDYLWLKEGMKKPRLAHELKVVRRCLALQWLSELQEDFRKLIAGYRETPGRVVSGGLATQVSIVRYSLSFYWLLAFAKVSVLVLGPYTNFSSLLWPAKYLKSLRERIPAIETGSSAGGQLQ